MGSNGVNGCDKFALSHRLDNK
ncbi:hypothetical protein A2U01_0117696, partial [Trifolium medium]|nr:hypothetical protein [Trifolium medium]